MKSRVIKSTLIIAIAVALTAIVVANRETIFKKNTSVGEFIPTNEWQEVLPGQSIPKGLKVRMDFNTHKKFAKLDDGVEDSANRGVVVSNPTDSDVREITEEEKLAKVIADALLNKEKEAVHETPDQMKERVLLSLPEPLEELKGYEKLSEEEKKRIIDTVWEHRQKTLAEAMKDVRGDADILIERLETLRSVVENLPSHLTNETEEMALQQTLTDIQWLILDVDNVEDLLKMNGEELLVKVFVQLASISEVNQDLLKESIVTIATLYKNALSIHDVSLCEEVMKSLLKLASSPEETMQRKVYYAMSVIIAKYPEMAEFFVKNDGVSLLEQAVSSSTEDQKRRALQMYGRLLALFPTTPSLSTVNVCSQCMEDLTSEQWKTSNLLLESYLELLKIAKDQGEQSCLDQLLQSDGFMKSMKEKYHSLWDAARQEMIEEGEEGYYTNMVHLMYNVFGKQMEWIVCFSSRRFDNNTIHKNT